MPDFRFSFLTQKDLPQLRETFLKAFADYVVPIQLNEEQFQLKIRREGIEANFSVAAYVGDEMVGFILTGLGEWQGKPTAYNAGTGVVPQYRGHQLTQQLYRYMLPKLRESGIEQCLLEVIQDNAPAFKSYRSMGFEVTRSFDCFRAQKEDLLLSVEAPEGVQISPAVKPDLKTYRCFRDTAPSWQNNFEAVKRSGEQSLTLEARNQSQEVVGYISFFTLNGAVAQLAVDPLWRGRGVGTALLREAVRLTEAPAIMFINVERTATGMVSFLERRHLRVVLQQYEMLLPIV
ncbi:GNAT family N-acetyltransferase [Pontibacter actiniarum]|uniref:GNAT family N-acetyltransferase n=1 Tax=Pontibacter actiniarum TaxID=323450 RepID=A0A1X9YXM9_9BACT|nr:GNAT family N-acetyltransferase [Pontibacter actiniarum]ARS37531.1 GNAT family N-acetyltransferase [Pontibacter actiniarum]